MKRYAIAFTALLAALCLLSLAFCFVMRSRTLMAVESLASELEKSVPSGAELYAGALFGTVPSAEAAEEGRKAMEASNCSGFAVRFFMERLWPSEAVYILIGFFVLAAAFAAAFMILDRKSRIRREERLTERVNAALRGETFRAENGDELLTARLLSEIKRLNTVREDSAEELRLYVENVAHEIKTPASGLVLNLDLAEKNGMTEDRLSALRNCALRIGSYVSSLLTLARVRAGKVRFAFEPLDTRELVEEIADDLRPNGVRLAIEGAGTEINGDRTRLKEAVQNLILNASKHGEADEPVQVELSGTETEAVICVKSSGIGTGREMPVERYAVGSENGSSSGIGLSLAREIAERHSGKLLIDITESGTDVNVTIPRFKLKTNFAE